MALRAGARRTLVANISSGPQFVLSSHDGSSNLPRGSGDAIESANSLTVL
jgi:hypothetical protein